MSPFGYVTIFGETGVPTLGWKEGSGPLDRRQSPPPLQIRQRLRLDPRPGDRSGVGASSGCQNEHGRIVLPPDTGEQPSLSSGLSDAPWLN